MEIKGNEIVASSGKEIYNISEPDVYGHKIVLGVNDTASNWAERPETIMEDTEQILKTTRSSKIQTGAKRSWIQIIIEKIKKLIKSIK